jgi:uncharacterized membrane protein YfcA
MEQYLWLIPVGFVIGAFATLVGAGGGFILAPVLLLLYPQESPETVTSISLAVVFFNSLSGSIAYARAKRIDYRSGLIFSAATIPGAILGALTTPLIPRGLFDFAFGILMMGASIFLFYCARREAPIQPHQLRWSVADPLANQEALPRPLSYRSAVGAAICFLIGYITSLLGVGGGFIEVPAMVYLLKFPVHVATATSQFIVAVMALTGSATHFAAGLFQHGVRRMIALSIGVVLGAQLGARLSGRVHGDWIIRGLAVALALVGARLMAMVF